MTFRRALAAACAALFLAAAARGQGPPLGDVETLAAFARLLSLVRFFHPSDAVAALSPEGWSRVAVAGVNAVSDLEDTAGPEALARTLEGFFRPLAPTLRVAPRGSKPELPPELQAGRAELRTVAWRHYGGDFGAEVTAFSSVRIDDQSPPGFGLLVQAVEAAPLRGRRVRLRAWVRTAGEGETDVHVGLQVTRPGRPPVVMDDMAGHPARDPAWRLHTVEGEVAADAERVAVLLMVTGGEAWLDDVSLEGARAARLANPGFDEGETGRQPPGWSFPYESVRAGYHAAVERGAPCRRGGCVRITADPLATPRFSRPAEVLEVDLAGGVAAWLPVSLYADGRGTLPHAPAAAPPPPWEGVDAAADTPRSRLAALALAWGIFQHLHPNLDPDHPAWRGVLETALAEAVAAPDREPFLRAARRLLVPLRDSRAGLFFTGGPERRSLPLAWEWIEDRLVVTGVDGGAPEVRPGDVALALDGRPAEEVLAEEEALTSAATPEARRRRAVEGLLWGSEGSRVLLRLRRGGAELEVPLVRDTPYDRLPAGTPLPAVAEPAPGVVYVDLGRIREEDVQALLPRLERARGLIFDLRRGANVSTVLLSHQIERTAASSNWQVPVVWRPGHRDVFWLTTFWTIEPKAPRLPGRAAYLADAGVDGYGETRLGIVEAYGLGEIVGSRSGGSNGSVNLTDLPGGLRLVWTGQRVLKHDGSPLHGVGIAPTVPASRTLAGVTAGRDEEVEAAVAAVLGQGGPG